MSGLAADPVGGPILVGIALTGFVLLTLVFRSNPRIALTVWLLALCFVPVWLGVAVGFHGNAFVPVSCALAIVGSLALLPGAGVQWNHADTAVACIVVIAIVAIFLGNRGFAITWLVSILTYWVPAYVFGRVITGRLGPAAVHAAVALVFTAVAILAIVEFFTHWNPFVLMRASNSLYSTWGGLQPRGNEVRAEGAFGHSIALGASLALAIPLTLGSRLPLWYRVPAAALMAGAAVASLSRTGMVTSLLGVALCLVFMTDLIPRRGRAALLTVILGAAVVLLPAISTVFDDAGAEASGSADFRVSFVKLLGQMRLVGVSASTSRDASGAMSFDGFSSLDDQLILMGVSSGLISLGIVIALLVTAIVVLLRRRAEPATIAMVAQIPAFVTVALVTQYAEFVLFTIGVAVTAQQLRRATEKAETAVSTGARPFRFDLPTPADPIPTTRLARLKVRP